MINVSKGDAIFIEFPDDTTWLIDQGITGSYVHDYIVNLGYTEIDTVLATHFDNDHLGGINEVLSPPLSYSTAAYEHAGQKADGETSYTATWDAETTDPMRSTPSAGQTWNFGGVEVQCICVGNTNTQRSYLFDGSYVSLSLSDDNRYSLGFRISWNGFDFIAMGDLISQVEDALASKLAPYNIDVLKVSHHGSTTSTSSYFCSKIKPEVAIISVGSSNTYSHPTQTTLNNLVNNGIEWIYVTAPGSYPGGSVATMSYIGDIVITYNYFDNGYTVTGTGTNDTYNADEGTEAATFTPTISPTATPTPTPPPDHVFSASNDFGSSQGFRGWYYEACANGTYSPLVWRNTDSSWQKEISGWAPPGLWAAHAHPAYGEAAVRKWTAPRSGIISISGEVYKVNTGGGDGVTASISKNGITLWERNIAYNDGTGYTYNLTDIVIYEGETVLFTLSENINDLHDLTFFDPTIIYTSFNAPSPTPVRNYLSLNVKDTTVSPGQPISLSWQCDFSQYNFRDKAVKIFIVAVKSPLLYDIPSNLKNARSGEYTVFFKKGMRPSFTFEGPTFNNVRFPPAPLTGTFTLRAPRSAALSGEWKFAAYFVYAKTGIPVRSDGSPVENTGRFRIE
jgi:beta-lactamase superfamily II metal-dependent hydrolase